MNIGNSFDLESIMTFESFVCIVNVKVLTCEFEIPIVYFDFYAEKVPLIWFNVF